MKDEFTWHTVDTSARYMTMEATDNALDYCPACDAEVAQRVRGKYHPAREYLQRAIDWLLGTTPDRRLYMTAKACTECGAVFDFWVNEKDRAIIREAQAEMGVEVFPPEALEPDDEDRDD